MENEERKKSAKVARNPKLRRRILLFIALLTAAALLLWLFVVGNGRNWDRLLRWTRFGNQEVVIGYEPGSVALGEGLGAGLVTLNGTSMTVYNSDGDISATVAVKLSQPMLQAGGNFTLAYDAGGRSLVLVSDAGSELLELEAEGAIFDADLSVDGAVSVLRQGSGDKTLLQVYNKNQKNIYTVHSVTRYFSRCSIQPGSGQTAVVALGQKEGAFASTLVLYATDREGAQAEVALGDQLILDVEYLSKDLICVVGESKAFFVGSDGSLRGSYAYDGALAAYDYSYQGYLSVVLRSSQGGGGWNLVTVNGDGRELARRALQQEITDLSVTGKYIAVLTPAALTVYNRELEVWSESAYVSGYDQVSMNEDGSAFLVGSENARRYVP